MNGRQCDEVVDGYFTGALDFLLFEGELASGSKNPVSFLKLDIFIRLDAVYSNNLLNILAYECHQKNSKQRSQ